MELNWLKLTLCSENKLSKHEKEHFNFWPNLRPYR